MSAENVGDQKERRRRRPLVGKAKVEETPRPVVAEGKGITAPKGRATPSRRRVEEEEDEGNVITRTGGGLAEYMEGVRSEIDKVAWPTREEAIRLTIIVLATLIAGAIILGLISAAFTELFRIGLNSPVVLIVFLLVAVGVGAFVYRTNARRSSSY